MTDDQQWQAPGARPLPPPSGPPAPFGRPAEVPGAPPAPTWSPPPAAGWTPPPKPGLVPLRPMTLGVILAGSFQVMRRNPRTTLVPALVVALLLGVASSAGVAVYMGALERSFLAGTSADAAAIGAGGLLAAGLVALLAAALATAATSLLQGVIVGEVARGTVGERLRFGELWAMYRGRFGALIGYTALIVLAVGLAMAIAIAIAIGVVAALAVGATSSTDAVTAALAGFGVTVLTMLGAAALGLWLSTKLAFVPAGIVLERLPIGAAIARSWRLTRGSFWRVLGILLLVQVMIGFATQLISTPVSFIATLGLTLLDPTGATSSSPDSILGTMTAAMILTTAITAIVTAVGLVVQSATSSLLYLDLRMRREGLDLELARYVEARQTGEPVADPYLPPGGRATAP